MYFFNDLDKYASNTAIVTEKSEKINYSDLLSFADLIGKQIMAVCNFNNKNIAGVVSEVLILGIYDRPPLAWCFICCDPL